MEVIWSKSSIKKLRKIYDYIAEDSVSNAHKVTTALVDLTLELTKNPTKHPLDKFKQDNDGTWRAFEKYNYRISYRVINNKIRVVRLRHCRQNPRKW